MFLHTDKIANNRIQIPSNFMTYNSEKPQALDFDFCSDKIMPQQMHICSLKYKSRLLKP